MGLSMGLSSAPAVATIFAYTVRAKNINHSASQQFMWHVHVGLDFKEPKLRVWCIIKKLRNSLIF